MIQFKYCLMQRVYLKQTISDIRAGSQVTIMGRYSTDNKCFYHIMRGDISFQSEDEHMEKDIPEELLSERPPYETLYAIKTEIFLRRNRKDIRNDDIFSVKYVLGNLDTARIEFYCEVDRCIVLTHDNLRYGKVSLYTPIIRDNGIVSNTADEVIDQKFFFERG